MSSDEVPRTENGSVNWTRVGQLVVGTWFLAWLNYAINMIDLITGAIGSGVTGFIEWITALIDGIFNVPDTVLDSAWTSASDFIAALGPIAIVAGVILAFGSLWLYQLAAGRAING